MERTQRFHGGEITNSVRDAETILVGTPRCGVRMVSTQKSRMRTAQRAVPTTRDFPFPLRPEQAHSFRRMDSPTNEAAAELLQTYTEGGGINYLDAAANLPSRPAIEAACIDLMSLMFPGFHGEPFVDSSDLPDVT